MDKDGNNDLHWACRRGQSDKVVELLQSGLAVNAMAMDGNTPLHLACREGHSDTVNVLLTHGADVKLVAKDGYTPLHCSCRAGFSGITGALLKYNPDVNALTNENYTPLHWACQGGNCDTIDVLLKSKPEVNGMASDGNTPLHLAVLRNDQKMVELLLSQDQLQVNVEDFDKLTPLLHAVSNENMGLIHTLVSNGADVNAGDAVGDTCLHLVLKKKKLNSENKRIDVLDKCWSKLGLVKEARLLVVVVASYLAEHGADLYQRNTYNTKPIDLIEDPALREKMKELYPPRLGSNDNQDQEDKGTGECTSSSHCRHPITSKDSQKLDEKDISKIAKQLSDKWCLVGNLLGIEEVQLTNIQYDYPNDIQEQGFQMLLKWFQKSRPEQCPVDYLKDVLIEVDCFEALQYLSSKKK